MKKLIVLFVSIVLAMPIIAQNNNAKRGLELYYNDDYKAALPLLQNAAKSGNAEAQCALGYMYRFGEGVAKNYTIAMRMYLKSAELGNTWASLMIGNMYNAGQGVPADAGKAFLWWKKAADKGVARGEYNVGYCFANGYGVEKDVEKAFAFYKLSAEQNDTDAMGRLAYCYYSGEGTEENYEEAYKWCSKLIELNGESLEANFYLGMMYSQGWGVEKDVQKAIRYMKIVADQGDSNGQYWLASFYYSEGDFKEAVALFQNAAEAGEPAAQECLGNMYNRGEGVAQNYLKAFEWTMKAAEQGQQGAQANLARYYYLGQGVEKDPAKAFEWSQKAAEDNFSYGVYEMGVCYEYGYGVVKDINKAKEYYKQAADGYSVSAIEALERLANEAILAEAKQKMAELGKSSVFDLASMYYKGEGVEKNYGLALKYFKAISAENEKAMYVVASMYLVGNGTDKDEKEAFRYFQILADKNNIDAQTTLGSMYYSGKGVEKNLKKAFEWTEKAANKGSITAQSNLGALYFEGAGVAKNKALAIQWSKKAADQGSTEGQKQVDEYSQYVEVGDVYRGGIVIYVDKSGKHGRLISVDEAVGTWDAAVSWCKRYSGGGLNWYLPGEYDLSGAGKSCVAEALRSIGKRGFSNAGYWTSEETSSGVQAWYYGITTGRKVNVVKGIEKYIRAVARF